MIVDKFNEIFDDDVSSVTPSAQSKVAFYTKFKIQDVMRLSNDL